MLKYKSLRPFKKVVHCQNILSTLSRVRICMETFILKGNILSSSRWEKFSLKDGLALIYLPSKIKFKWTIKMKRKDLLQKFLLILSLDCLILNTFITEKKFSYFWGLLTLIFVKCLTICLNLKAQIWSVDFNMHLNNKSKKSKDQNPCK